MDWQLDKQLAVSGTLTQERMFYKIRDVAEIVGVKPHVLCYCESEFPNLSPKKNRSGQRIYTRKDISQALEIKQLLHVERFSIAGAKQNLKNKKSQPHQKNILEEIKEDLRRILELVEVQGK